MRKKTIATILTILAICLLCYVVKIVFFDDNKLTPEEHRRLHAELNRIFSESTALFEKWHQTSEDQREGHLTLEDLEQLYAYIVQCNTALLEQLKALPYSGIPLPAREETGRPPPYNTTDKQRTAQSEP